MLRRRLKRRYLLIWHDNIKDVDVVEILTHRCAELFGRITLEKASLRQIRSYGDLLVLSCNLSEIHPVLVTIALSHPPLVALDMSGSLRRLELRMGRPEHSRPLLNA